MRYILGLCAVLAVGNSAWTSEMGNIAGEPGYQTPAATVTNSVTQATGTPAVTTTSPVNAYQAVTGQPATTTMSPAPTMMSPGTYAVGNQPVATYATPMANTTYSAGSYPTSTTGSYPAYTTGSYPMTVRRGLFGMRASRMYSYQTTPVTTTYTTPAQSYTVMPPGQNYYYQQPARPRFGLFQRWRQQAMPASTAPVYGTPMYSASGYAAPVNTTYGYTTPTYYTTTYATPAATAPTGSMTSAGTNAGNAAPVYTPTTLNAPNDMPATAAPAEPPLQGTTPAQTVPTPPGAGQATTPSVPNIPQRSPR